MSIRVIKNNKEIRIFYKSQFEDFRFLQKEEIYNLKHKEKCDFVCDCSDNNPELTIIKKNGKFFFRNYPNNGEKHKITCPFHSKYKGVNDYEKGWRSDNEGNLIANLKPSIFGKKEESLYVNSNNERNLYNKEVGGANRVTLLGLMTKLNLITWDRYVLNKNKTIDNVQTLITQSFRTSNNILIKKNTSLNDYWFNFGKFKELKKGQCLFVYMPLKTVKRSNIDKYCRVILSLFINGKETELVISCPMDIFEKAYESIKIKDLKKEGNKFKAIAGGFIKKNNKGFREFISIEFMPIIEQGLWCESSHENIVYSKLIKENRLFSKGYKPIDIYGNFIPDIIFRDTKKPCYGEVFGIRNVDVYNERKEEKKKLAQKSKNMFDFWYWDVDELKNPPDFIF